MNQKALPVSEILHWFWKFYARIMEIGKALGFCVYEIRAHVLLILLTFCQFHWRLIHWLYKYNQRCHAYFSILSFWAGFDHGEKSGRQKVWCFKIWPKSCLTGQTFWVNCCLHLVFKIYRPETPLHLNNFMIDNQKYDMWVFKRSTCLHIKMPRYWCVAPWTWKLLFNF